MAGDIRYMNCKAVRLYTGELIPAWDCTFSFQYDAVQSVECEGRNYSELSGAQLIDAVYDLKKHTLHPYSIVLRRLPADYAVGDRVGHEEAGHHCLKLKVIKAIQDGRFEDRVEKGSELTKDAIRCPEMYEKSRVFEPKIRYTQRTIYPAYVLDDGTIVEWGHQLYRIEE